MKAATSRIRQNGWRRVCVSHLNEYLNHNYKKLWEDING